MSNILRRRTTLTPRATSKREFLTPFDRLFDDMFEDMFPMLYKDLGDNFFVKGSYPKVNVIDGQESLTIEAAIPGMNKDDVSVEISEGVLTIRGESNQQEGIDDGQYLKREIKKSSFYRSFRLNDNLSHDDILASYDNGILTLSIPKVVPTEEPPNIKRVAIS